MMQQLGLQYLQPDASVYAQRRARLLAQMDANSIAILPTAHEYYRNRDADYKFRADSSFYYLTGFAEPEALLCLDNSLDSSSDAIYTLFCRERDKDKEIWHGKRAGTLGAVETFKANQAFDIALVDEKILTLLAGKTKIYTRLGVDSAFDSRLCGWLKQLASQQRAGVQPPCEIAQIDSIIDEMRLFKDDDELIRMRMAAKISAEAHVRAMQMVKPNMMEYTLEAELQYIFSQHGCQLAYNTIVGGGENGCILHYTENNAPLKTGDLVLIDAGAELDHYAADITRTFPVNGQFSPAQKALYQLVLDAQLAAIATIKIGANWDDPHDAAVKVLVAGLIHLDLLHGTVEENIEKGSYKQFYMHRTGHWLGMDVHDVGSYREATSAISPTTTAPHNTGKSSPLPPRILQAGMVFTVEPGLYIAPDDLTVDAKWRGIGIRIEDDVLVTIDGCEILTQDVPKDIESIERLMQQSS